MLFLQTTVEKHSNRYTTQLKITYNHRNPGKRDAIKLTTYKNKLNTYKGCVH